MAIKKKGIYFTLDAFFATMLLLIGIILITKFSFTEISTEQIDMLSKDMLLSFGELKVGELNNSWVRDEINNGSITNPDNTIIEQIGAFWAVGQTDKAQTLSQILVEDLMPSRYGVSIVVEGTTVYTKNKSAQPTDIISSRRMLTGIEAGSPVEGSSSTAYIRNIKNKKTSSYAYFGGFVGQGNISVSINDLPDDINSSKITDMTIELEALSEFNLLINDVQCNSTSNSSQFTPMGGNMTPDVWNITHCTYSVMPRKNNFTLNFLGELNESYIAGGYIRVIYKTDEFQTNQTFGNKKYYFPGIYGLINLYDSFFVPGTLNNASIYLHYFANHTNITNATFYLTIGDKRIFTDVNSTTEQAVYINNSNLSAQLNYTAISQKTVPIRVGFENITFLTVEGEGNADIILITDISGSMNWRVDSDRITGVTRTCTDPSLYDPDTKRISVAKCLDKEFVDFILNTTGNRIGLVAYSGNPNYIPTASSTTIVSTYDLSTNNVSLKNEIDSYNPGGATGVCGAIRQARIMLGQQSNSSRQKFIVLMTDGLANVQCSPTNENSTIGCISRLCPDTSYCSEGGCLYRVAEDVGYRSTPALAFNLTGDDRWTLISGESGGTFKGYYWNYTKWITDSSRVAGLGDIGSRSNPAIAFNVTGDGFWTLISGDYYGNFDGFYWSGSQWVSDSSRVSGLGDVGSYSAPTFAFNLTGNNDWTLVSGAYDGNFDGFYWSGSQWVSDSSRVSGLGDIGRYSNPSLSFNVTGNNDWTLITGEEYGRFYGYYWSGSQWVSDSTRASGLTDVGYRSSPIMAFNVTADNSWLLLSGEYYGNYFSHFWIGNTWVLVCGDYVSDKATEDAVNDACKAYNDTGAVVHSIGFGPVSYCPSASSNLQSVATCGNGSYYSSTNSSELQAIYKDIAEDVVIASRSAQIIMIEGNYTPSTLYPDSYIEFNYTPIINAPQSNEISIVFQTPQLNNCNTSINIYQGLRLVEARVTSYSGEHWTDLVAVNNDVVYNLSEFSSNYVILGDPYTVDIPVTSLINGNNTVTIRTGDSPANSTGCSANNSFIYKAMVNSSIGRLSVVEQAEGCNWVIEFEDGTFLNASFPTTYSGPDNCSYTNTSISYKINDAYDVAVYNLLKSLDFDSNGRVLFNLATEDFEIVVNVVSGIPYMWGPSIIEVRVWQ